MSCRSFEEQIHNFTIYKLPISLIKLTRDEVATTVDKLLAVSAAMTTFVNLPHNSQHVYSVGALLFTTMYMYTESSKLPCIF